MGVTGRALAGYSDILTQLFLPSQSVELSRLLFFMVLEIGVGLVAVCLPSIWMVFSTMAPEAFLRSVHSLVSLASNGTRGSRGSKALRGHSRKGVTLQPNTSTSSFVPISGTASDAYEMSIAKGESMQPVPSGHILNANSTAKNYEEV